ncbi:MAG: carboxylesterase family protein [Ruthenibacterium lactatiformans]
MKNHFVHTPCGPVQGAAGGADGVSVFRGIRYATAGRWEYPRQVTHWDGVYDAANFGACSFQPRAFYSEEDVPEKAFYYNEFRRGEHYDYSEDCLFLNIWAPDDAKNAPVLFYIHGGGFLGGCGHEKHFDGTAWCKKGVVAVTINYRLGPMGFLCLPELAARDGHTGNYAMFDQMAALCWVRDNIAAFGGDRPSYSYGPVRGRDERTAALCFAHDERAVRGAVMMSGGGVSRLLGAAQKAEEAYPFWQAVRQKAGRGRFCGAVRRRTAGAVRRRSPRQGKNRRTPWPGAARWWTAYSLRKARRKLQKQGGKRTSRT